MEKLVVVIAFVTSYVAAANAQQKFPYPLDDKSIDQLMRLLEDSPPATRREAAFALAMAEKKALPALPILIQSLKDDPDAEVRGTVAFVLGGLGYFDKRGLEPLINALRSDKDAGVRTLAAQALMSYREWDDAVPVLIKALDDPAEPVRWRTVRSLSGYGPRAKGAIPRLLVLLKTGDEQTRRDAAVTLGDIGSQEKKVLEALQTSEKDSSAQVQEQSRIALQKLDKR